jgi:hypothetical protein
MATPYGPQHERKRKKERELEREVLLYLRGLNAAVNWEKLYAQFDLDRTGSIGPVLHALKDGRYIATDDKNKLRSASWG